MIDCGGCASMLLSLSGKITKSIVSLSLSLFLKLIPVIYFAQSFLETSTAAFPYLIRYS